MRIALVIIALVMIALVLISLVMIALVLIQLVMITLVRPAQISLSPLIFGTPSPLYGKKIGKEVVTNLEFVQTNRKICG